MIRTVKKYNKDKKKVKVLIKRVKEVGGLDYARTVMLEYRKQAMDILDSLPSGPAAQSLRDLIAFVTDRDK
jgi:octaprenyl-diphosphate synthase